MFADNSINNDLVKYGWQRNPKWMSMPETQTDVQRILMYVFDIEDASNSIAVKMTVTGGYTVDWGDGTVENFASGVQASHSYNYSSLTWVIDDFTKQVMITIYPQVQGNNFSAVRFDEVLSTNIRGAIAELQINAPQATTLGICQNASLREMECCIIHAIGAITSTMNLFNYALRLKKVVFPEGSLQSVTTADTMFGNCESLEHIYLPDNAFVNTTDMNRMFWYTNLKEFIAPSGFGNAVTILTQLLAYCYNLKYVKFAAGSLQNVTRITWMFYNDVSLYRIDFPSGAFGSVSASYVSSPFFGCDMLRRITNLSIPVSFTLNGRFAGAELNEIYTALPTVTGKTITVTGIHGTVDDDPTIATAKGWTVTGS